MTHTVLVAMALGIAQVCAYAVSVVSARALGPDGFGVLAALLGILRIGSVLAMGIQAVAARRLVGLVWLLRLDGWAALLLAALAFIPLTWAGAQYGVAQGRESYRRLAAIYAVVGLGRGVGGVAGALLTGSVVGTMAGLTAGTILGAIVGRLLVAPLVAATPVRLENFFADSAHATHALLALFVLTNIDVLLARALLDSEQAGLYGVGAVIAKVAFWLPQFVGVVAFPRFADARRSRATIISLAAVGGIGALVVVVTALLPGVIVGFVGGSAYISLVPIAWLFAAIGATFALAQALLLTRLAVDDRRAVIAIWAAAGLLVLLATLVLPATVGGLAASALLAGLALACVGLVVAGAEVISRRPQGVPNSATESLPPTD